MQSEEQQRSGIHATLPAMLMHVPVATHTVMARPVPISDEVTVDTRQAWLTFLAASRQHSTTRMLYCLVFKRWLDAATATLMLIALAPLMLLVAILIRIESPGQVIYRQDRVGRDGKLFTIYKFRTMIPDRRSMVVPISGDDRRKRHKTASDPRVTAAGRFLRRSSIDELPQLFNILKGDMSFVGPRPELPRIVDNYADWQHQRHLVTPGLSGWWQVEGRSDLPMHEHTELDIYYVINQSFGLDARIVLRTFRALLSRGGAF